MVGAALLALCLSAGALEVKLPIRSFTLRWQHSIEKTEWAEDYEIAGPWLLLSQARIRGSGAGMEPPADAVLIQGVWHYRPADRWRRELLLARSGFTPDHELCFAGRCRPISHWLPQDDGRQGATVLRACPKE
ncbi:DUF1850 domain-containing protein [Pelomonas sp. SE-A7]|uniref:DUF1850 domain-containing protein n=1 Tax=Pelomonas sp. SE-A7 TaxID=3054953 RepID=UPI00259CD2D6|nr:DUF1850 domain-containing protein [Pelomonas sp. SE-A7]MDM4765702.1 DUF1850 domain-containing protein [Pelomonas sp. SE-A7]